MIPQAFLVLAVLFSINVAMAGIVISIDRETALAGETILLGVYASSETGDVISGYNLPFDYNSDGFVDVQNDGIGDLPLGFTLAPSPLTSISYANAGLDQPFPQLQLVGTDAIVTGTGSDIVLGNSLNPTKLFDLVVVTDPSVAAGTVVTFQIKVPEAPFASLFNVAGPSSPSVLSPSQGVPVVGSITIVAVPEPSSIGLLLSVLILPFGRRGWRHLVRRTGERER